MTGWRYNLCAAKGYRAKLAVNDENLLSHFIDRLHEHGKGIFRGKVAPHNLGNDVAFRTPDAHRRSGRIALPRARQLDLGCHCFEARFLLVKGAR